jgi:hypothetical protein
MPIKATKAKLYLTALTAMLLNTTTCLIKNMLRAHDWSYNKKPQPPNASICMQLTKELDTKNYINYVKLIREILKQKKLFE